MLTNLLSVRKWFGSYNCSGELSLVESVLSGLSRHCFEFRAYRWPFVDTMRQKLKLTAHLHLLPSQRMRGGAPLLHSNQLRYLLYRSTETIWHSPVQGCNSGRFSVSSDSD